MLFSLLFFIMEISPVIHESEVFSMDYSVRNRSIRSLVSEIARGKHDFTHPLQRREGQWSSLQRSELIDSMFRNYPIDPIRAVNKDGKYYIIDGKQRETEVYDYLNGSFRLHPSLKPFLLDGTVYEVRGLYFDQLPEELQEHLYNYEFQFYLFTDCTEEDITEMFRRQNRGGKPLTNTEVRTSMENPAARDQISSLARHPFLAKTLTISQRKRSEDKEVIREILMLCDPLYETDAFTNTSMNRFMAYYNEHQEPSLPLLIRQAMDILDEAYPIKCCLKRTTVPMAVYGLAETLRTGRSCGDYMDWLNEFIRTYTGNKAYTAHCQGATASKAKVLGRLAYFQKAVESLPVINEP